MLLLYAVQHLRITLHIIFVLLKERGYSDYQQKKCFCILICFKSISMHVSCMPEIALVTAACTVYSHSLRWTKWNSIQKLNICQHTHKHTHTNTTMKEGISTASTPTQGPFWSALRPTVSVPQGQMRKHTDTHVQTSQTHSLHYITYISTETSACWTHTPTDSHVLSSWGRERGPTGRRGREG